MNVGPFQDWAERMQMLLLLLLLQQREAGVRFRQSLSHTEGSFRKWTVPLYRGHQNECLFAILSGGERRKVGYRQRAQMLNCGISQWSFDSCPGLATDPMTHNL
jgi:hypothetical protein